MLFSFRIGAFAVLTAVLISFPAALHAESPKAITDNKGNPPNVVLVEQPHDAIRAWYSGKKPNRPLILIGANIGITAADDKDIASITGLMEKGDWDGLLAKDYPTAKAYPVNPSNYLYVAYKAGIISEIYWVPPSRTPVGKEPLWSFKEYLAGLGIGKDELDALTQSRDCISGRMNGVPVHVYNLKDLPKPDEDALVLIGLRADVLRRGQDAVSGALRQLRGNARRAWCPGIRRGRLLLNLDGDGPSR
jgi:hypothetical protein